jgi:hypothetical protein
LKCFISGKCTARPDLNRLQFRDGLEHEQQQGAGADDNQKVRQHAGLADKLNNRLGPKRIAAGMLEVIDYRSSIFVLALSIILPGS